MNVGLIQCPPRKSEPGLCEVTVHSVTGLSESRRSEWPQSVFLQEDPRTRIDSLSKTIDIPVLDESIILFNRLILPM